MERTGKITKFLGGVSVLADVVTVEEILNDDGYFYRMTECTDAGLLQATWHKDDTPEIVFKLMDRLEENGSRIENNRLLGPHLMRGNSLRLIMDNVPNLNSTTQFDVQQECEIDLIWLENLLAISMHAKCEDEYNSEDEDECDCCDCDDE